MPLDQPEENAENNDKETLKKKCLKIFQEFRFQYYDELPPNRLLPTNPEYHYYKCRGNFFAAVKNYIWLLISQEVITEPEVIQKGLQYIEYVKKRDLSKFSTENDIKIVNDILDCMIDHLK